MACPNCGRALIKENLSGQDIDVCPSCGGMWCPTANIGWYIRLYSQSDRPVNPNYAVSLTKYRKKQGRRSARRGSTCEIPQGRGDGPDIAEATVYTCPSCGSSMAEFEYDADATIFLDRCTICGGIWIDLGELEELTDHLIPPTPQLPEPIEQEPVLNDDHDRESVYAVDQGIIQSQETRFFDEMNVPLIRRILGIPCVEAHLTTTPWMTIFIIALNIAVYLFLIDPAPDREEIFKVLGFAPVSIFSDPGYALFTFFCSMFIHNDITHLAGNMIFFWLFGGRIEEDFGRKTFIMFYLISGIAAGLMHAVFNLTSSVPMVGASGAISGILGAFFVLHPRLRVITYVFIFVPIRFSAAVFLGFWLVMQVLNSIATAHTGGAGIAWFAHIGGFAAGALMAYPLRNSSEAAARQISQAA